MTDVAPGAHIAAALEECILAKQRLLISAQNAYDQSRKNYVQAIQSMASNELKLAEITLAITELQAAKAYYLAAGQDYSTPPIPTEALTVENDASAIVQEDHQPDQEHQSDTASQTGDELRP